MCCLQWKVKGQGWRQFADCSRFQNRQCVETSTRRKDCVKQRVRMCACLISVSDRSKKEENEFALNRETAKTMLKENDICVEKQKEEQKRLTPSQKVINKSTDPLGVCGDGNRTVLVFSHCTLTYL